jgi:hypothetical protein
MLYATLPAPHLQQMKVVAKEPLIGGVRFNIGAKTPYEPSEALQKIITAIGNKEFWIDLKGRQPRVIRWGDPTYGDIVINHNISVDLPAEVVIRHDRTTRIVAVEKNKIYVDPQTMFAVGEGQALNIHGNNLVIEGYFTEDDIQFAKAAQDLGIHRYMLSYVEQASDISDMIAMDPQAKIVAKIETLKGLEFVRDIYPSFNGSIRLMAAMDDLYLNIGPDETAIIEALESIIDADPNAIAASRLFLSLETSEKPSLPDLAFYCFLESIGYESFMLSDNLCKNQEAFARTMGAINRYNGQKKTERRKNRVRDYLKRVGLWR